MIKNIYVPKDLRGADITVNDVLVERGDRVLRNAPLVNLSIDNTILPVLSEYDGWIKYVAIKPGKRVSPSGLLLVIDVISTTDYRLDEDEVNPHSELGESGRRGAERDGQRKYGKGNAAVLFDAPEQAQENAQAQKTSSGHGSGKYGSDSALKENPLMRNMKESVPSKMQANAAQNAIAVKQMSEEASMDPELRKQLSNELQMQLEIHQAPSATPTPSK